MKRLDGKQILLADDEADVRSSFVLMLKAAGAIATEAVNGAKALELYQHGNYDCVVTDHNMPEMKGDALAKDIKTRNPKQRVVMVSGFAETVLVNGQLPWYIDVLLPKPCRMDDLLEAISPSPGKPMGRE